MEQALSVITRESIQLTGAGRTDTGVHAAYFVAHFETENTELDNPDFVYKLNSYLGSDIVIYALTKVTSDAHARFSALSRTYVYHINLRKDPFRQETAYYFPRSLNVDAMNEACEVLFKYTDFTSFSKLHTDVKTNNCKIEHAEWIQKDHELIFTISADRFLRNMVRAIVGTLLEIGLGKIDRKGFIEIIEQKDRGEAGASVPACGLSLIDIKYPESIFKRLV